MVNFEIVDEPTPPGRGKMKTHAGPERALRFIRTYTDEHGWPPSRREIAESIGASSASTAQDALRELIEQGLITITPRAARSVKITAAGMKALTEAM